MRADEGLEPCASTMYPTPNIQNHEGAKADWALTFAATAYNLARLPKLLESGP